MRFKILFLPVFLYTLISQGQTGKNTLLQAYQAKSSQKLQQFFDMWLKEATIKTDSNAIRLNDTLNNLYGILNTVYKPPSSGTKYILMQPELKYNIVDNLNKDTLLKRAIYSMFKKNPDSVYALALSKPGAYDNLAEDNGLAFYTILKYGSIRISTQNLKYKEKTVLPLTNDYFSVLTSFVPYTYNTAEQFAERNKRLTFLLNDIQYCYGDNGTIRIGNPPYGISVTVDAQFQNALVEYRECNNGVQARLSKTNNGWVVIDSHITWIY